MKEKLAALYELQQLDSALAALQKQYAALDKGQAEEAAFEAARAAHAEAEAALHTVSTDLRDSELEQKTVEAKRKEFETKLYSGKVTAAKELQAMQEEVEMLGRNRSRLDEKILALMDDLESRRATEAARKQEKTAHEAAHKTKRNAYKKEAERLVAQARELAAQRTAAAKKIDPALLKRYESLRAARNGLAIVALEDANACGGCKMALPSSFVSEVHLGTSIATCQNCGRIVYDAHAAG